MKNMYIGEVSRFDRVIIYGAGQIGRKVLGVLENANMKDKVVCFAVSDIQNAPQMVNDVAVKAIDEIPEEYDKALFLLSVGDKFMYELEQMVIRKKINHYFDGRKIYRVIGQSNDEQKHIAIDIRELFMQQYRNGVFNRLDIIVRYLAIENYYNINDYGFALYCKMQSQRISSDYVEGAVKKFKELIVSWEQAGYDSESEIECDRELHLIDGSHRIAMGLYHRVYRIHCKVNSYADDIEYSLDWFIEHGFGKEEIRKIQEKFNEIYQVVCRPISCVLWPAVYNYFDEITEKLGFLYKIKGVKDYCFKGDTFDRAVKGIYHIDDIESWKIDKKIEYLKLYPAKIIRVIELDIPQPHFRLKNSNNHTILTEGENIKRIFRNCYRKNVDNYFYDIIMHTGDNYEQSEYILNLFKPAFSLREFFAKIHQYKWILIKTDTPVRPDNFPDAYPFSKDIDIVCTDEDYEAIIDEAIEFLKNAIGRIYKLNVINGVHRTKIRVEQNGYLVLQFDISRSFVHMEKKFIKNSIKEREYINGYYVAKLEYELIYRMYEFLLFPHKNWHLDYIKKNKNFWNANMAKEALPYYRDKIKQIWDTI